MYILYNKMSDYIPITDEMYNRIINDINLIFDNIDNDISRVIFKIKGIKTRKSKLSFKDTLLYSLNYCNAGNTKFKIVADFNFNNDKKDKNGNDVIINRTTFYEKEKLIPTEIYLGIFHKIVKLYNDYFKDTGCEFKIIIVDGTYNNTNQYNIKDYLETSLNLGFFDLNNDIPIDLTFNGIKDKNNELKLLKEYIGNNKDKFNNCIFILDRAYSSYKFIKFLDENNIKYIIRFKNNSKNIPKNNRVVEFECVSRSNVENDNINIHTINGKKFKSVILETKNKYTLVSNLNSNHSNDDIKSLYQKRWNIEVFFKTIKSNFKMNNLRITNMEQTDDIYTKHNIKILIMMVLSKVMEKLSMKLNKNKIPNTIKKRIFKNKKVKKLNEINKKKNKKNKRNNEGKKINVSTKNNENIKLKPSSDNNDKNNNSNEIKCIVKPSIINIIKGTYKIIDDMINGKLTKEITNKFISCYVTYNKIDQTINNKRKCKTPFLKWYIKGYTNKSDNVKIVNHLLGFSKEKLNKNLAMKCKNSIITKINYV
jgi:hypothetical protein